MIGPAEWSGAAAAWRCDLLSAMQAQQCRNRRRPIKVQVSLPAMPAVQEHGSARGKQTLPRHVCRMSAWTTLEKPPSRAECETPRGSRFSLACPTSPTRTMARRPIRGGAEERYRRAACRGHRHHAPGADRQHDGAVRGGRCAGRGGDPWRRDGQTALYRFSARGGGTGLTAAAPRRTGSAPGRAPAQLQELRFATRIPAETETSVSAPAAENGTLAQELRPASFNRLGFQDAVPRRQRQQHSGPFDPASARTAAQTLTFLARYLSRNAVA